MKFACLVIFLVSSAAFVSCYEPLYAEPVQCPDLQAHIPDGVKEIRIMAGAAFYYCNDDFFMFGENPSLCQSNKKWRLPAPQCIRYNPGSCAELESNDGGFNTAFTTSQTTSFEWGGTVCDPDSDGNSTRCYIKCETGVSVPQPTAGPGELFDVVCDNRSRQWRLDSEDGKAVGSAGKAPLASELCETQIAKSCPQLSAPTGGSIEYFTRAGERKASSATINFHDYASFRCKNSDYVLQINMANYWGFPFAMNRTCLNDGLWDKWDVSCDPLTEDAIEENAGVSGDGSDQGKRSILATAVIVAGSAGGLGALVFLGLFMNKRCCAREPVKNEEEEEEEEAIQEQIA